MKRKVVAQTIIQRLMRQFGIPRYTAAEEAKRICDRARMDKTWTLVSEMSPKRRRESRKYRREWMRRFRKEQRA